MRSDQVVSFELKGMDQLQKQLDSLGAELGLKVLAKAARKAFTPVLEAARALVPVDSGELRDAIRLSMRKPGSGEAVVVVGLKVTKGQAQEGKLPPSARWHFIEFGTARIAAHPFLRPALDQNAGAVLEKLKEELIAEILRVTRKLAKK